MFIIFPNHGDMVFDSPDTFYNNVSNNSIRLRDVIAHEHGHGMGQSHVRSDNAAFLMEPSINTSFDGPQYHEILVAQRGYGDANERSFSGLGNDVAARATALGALNIGQSVARGNSARTLVVAPTAIDFISIDDNNDTDFFSFSVPGAVNVGVLVEALGFNYNVTPQSGAGNVPFDTRFRSDMTVTLFDTNGTTILRTVNLTGFAGHESLGFTLPGAGTYFVRVMGVDNPDGIALDTQFYGLTINVLGVPEPTTWALLGFGTLGVGFGCWRWRHRRKGMLENSVDNEEEE